MGTVAGGAAGADHNTHAVARLAAQQTLGVADTMTDVTGVSVALEPGTWFVFGQALFGGPTGTTVVLEITDAANVAVAGSRNGTSAAQYQTVTTSEIVTPAVTTTYKLRAHAATVITTTIEVHDAIDANARATRLVAVRLV